MVTHRGSVDEIKSYKALYHPRLYSANQGVKKVFFLRLRWNSNIRHHARSCTQKMHSENALGKCTKKMHSENPSRLVAKRGWHGLRRSMRRPRKLGIRVRQLMFVLIKNNHVSIFVNNNFQNAVFFENCFAIYAHIIYKRKRRSW